MTADFIAKVLAAATVLAVIPRVASAQDLHCDRGDVEVRSLDFVGNKAFVGTQLAKVIMTTPSAWGRRVLHLPFSAKRCLDRTEYANDRLRLMLFYRRQGFPDVTVDTALIPNGTGAVRVRFTITEGVPVMLNSFVILGLDSVRHGASLLRNLPIRAGERFDRNAIDAVKDSIARRLRNRGYPAALVNNYFGIHNGPAGPLAEDSMIVEPGPLTRIGPTRVEVTPAPGHARQIADPVVRSLVRIDSGRLYREHEIADAQRALYQTDAYAHVAIGLDSAHGSRVGADSVVPLHVSLVENAMHAARVGAGYGTLDCFRASGELDDYNFMHQARRLELQARVSKIGIGHPLDGAPQLCSQAQHDPYSTQLNYYLGATLKQPFFLGLRTVPTVTAYTSRVSEYNAYVRTTLIGGIGSVVWQKSLRTPVTFSYGMDFGRTEAQPALFCAVFNLCADSDRVRVQKNQRLGVLSMAIAHDASNNPTSPTAGGTARFEIRHASPLVFSDTALQFNTFLGDVARYVSVGGGNVLALHVRAGTVLGREFRSNTGFIPPQERMYGGGPTSVRGFAQNELGAVTYLARSYETGIATISGVDTTFFFRDSTRTYRRAVPVGGNSLVVGNVELRLRSPVLPDVLQVALFTDAGDVWNRGNGSVLQDVKLKVTPGVQVAALTPVGPVRLVVGYNPYQRPSGPLYYENSSAAGGTLPCVSPGNTLPVQRDSTGVLVQQGKCPATFQPARTTSFRSRLTFGLAIGQAF